MDVSLTIIYAVMAPVFHQALSVTTEMTAKKARMKRIVVGCSLFKMNLSIFTKVVNFLICAKWKG